MNIDKNITIMNNKASATQASSPRASTSLSPRASAAARDLWDDVEESEVAMPRAITIHNFFPGAHTGKLLRMWPFSPSPSPERPRSLEEATLGLGSLPSGLDNAPSGLAAAPAATAPAAAAAPTAAEAWPRRELKELEAELVTLDRQSEQRELAMWAASEEELDGGDVRWPGMPDVVWPGLAKAGASSASRLPCSGLGPSSNGPRPATTPAAPAATPALIILIIISIITKIIILLKKQY